MREMFRHNHGRIFLVILSLSVVGILWVPAYFLEPHIFFSWLTLPFLAGIIFLLVWLLAYVIVNLLTPKPSDHIELIFFDEVEHFLREKT